MTPQEFIEQLQSLDAKNPGAWPTWARYGAVGLLFIVIVVAGGYFLIKPEMDSYAELQTQEETLRTDFVGKQQKAASLEEYRAQLEEMRKNFGSMLRQLPNKTEVPSLLNDISQTRVAASLEEELFKPSPEVMKEFYAEMPNQIIVTGTYHQMGTFVSNIAILPRIVTIDDVEIRPAGTKGMLRMQAFAKTYRYLDEQEEASAKPKGPTGLPGGAK
jgi:type IV pilus assembly protein PilO